MDLNVRTEKSNLAQTLEIAARLGYEVVAINNVVDNIDNTMRKKKKDKEYQPIAAPEDIKLNTDALRNIKTGRKGFRQLSRISVVIDNPGQLHKLQTPDIQAYDLIAVKPTSEKLFHVAATTLNVDIITIEVTQKLPYQIKRPSINVALERGIYFEIEYAPAIRDSTYRKYMIANAQTLMRVCKGKNVILTSGCQRAMELRGPHDVTNLGLLFGMTPPQAKAAVTSNCQSLLLHSESRKLLKSTIGAVKIEKVDEKDKWILEQTANKKDSIESESKQTANKKDSIESESKQNGNMKKDNNSVNLKPNELSLKRGVNDDNTEHEIAIKKMKMETTSNVHKNDVKDGLIK